MNNGSEEQSRRETRQPTQEPFDLAEAKQTHLGRDQIQWDASKCHQQDQEGHGNEELGQGDGVGGDCRSGSHGEGEIKKADDENGSWKKKSLFRALIPCTDEVRDTVKREDERKFFYVGASYV